MMSRVTSAPGMGLSPLSRRFGGAVLVVIASLLHAAAPAQAGDGARLSARPNPVPTEGGLGTTTIAWKTGDSTAGRVYVTEGGQSLLFARGAAGTREAPWIKPGTRYTFRLYAGASSNRVLASITVVGQRLPTGRRSGRARLSADPNPVPTDGEMGTTTISWTTGGAGVGEVYVTEGAQSVLFARGAAGSREAPWVKPGTRYTFRLYAGTRRGKVLASLVVLGERRAGGGGPPRLSADPNPVPTAGGPGTTTISWTTGDGSIGEVLVSEIGGRPRLFARGVTGSSKASIQPGTRYVFRLYGGSSGRRLLLSTRVTGSESEPGVSTPQPRSSSGSVNIVLLLLPFLAFLLVVGILGWHALGRLRGQGR
jgi:hypothetical protein